MTCINTKPTGGNLMRKALLAVAVLSTALPATALAQPSTQPTRAETKPMSASQDDAMFAMQMAEHHRAGIKMADDEIAHGSSDEVKAFAKRIKADQQKDVVTLDAYKPQGQNAKPPPMPMDPDMEKCLARLDRARGVASDQLFLELMIVHHASALTMSHAAMGKLRDPALKSLARDIIAKQAREIGELQRMRDANRSAQT
jgi:uncharacterized protein (DUF305 family)